MRSSGKLFAAAVVAASIFAVSSARAALLVSDSFPYDNGNLVGNTPALGGVWNAHSGAGAMPVQVSNQAILLAQGSGSREDVNVPFDGGFADSAGTILYASFDLSVGDPGAAVTSTYFAHFLQGTGSFDSRVFVDPGMTSGYRVGISNGTSTASADTADLAFGQTYKVVLSYDYSNKSGSLWIDPTSMSSPSIAASDTSGHSDAVTAFAFRQSTGNTTETVDNLLVGTSFADVVPGAGVPEPASLGLIGLAGIPLLRRRKSR